MLEERYANSKNVNIIMDNLNSYNVASIYMVFSQEKDRNLASHLEINQISKNGSWFNVTEIEMGA